MLISQSGGKSLFFEKYLSGLPDIRGNQATQVEFKGYRVEIRISRLFSSNKVLILKTDDIIEIALNKDVYRHVGHTAAGAIVGSALAGGIGLIAGAAMGGQRRTKNQLYLIVRYNNALCDIVFASDKDTHKLYFEFKKLMSRQTIATDESEKNSLQSIPEISVADEIEKLYALVEKGILTHEEFDIQKKKLLGL